jgi:hypothetical protein
VTTERRPLVRRSPSSPRIGRARSSVSASCSCSCSHSYSSPSDSVGTGRLDHAPEHRNDALEPHLAMLPLLHRQPPSCSKRVETRGTFQRRAASYVEVQLLVVEGHCLPSAIRGSRLPSDLRPDDCEYESEDEHEHDCSPIGLAQLESGDDEADRSARARCRRCGRCQR